jgi:hypothetical protein
LYSCLFGKDYIAHNALEDVRALSKLFQEIDVSIEILKKHSFCISSTVAIFYFRMQSNSLFNTFLPLVEKKVLSKCMASKLANSGLALQHLKLALKRDGQQGIQNVLSETSKYTQKARVTKSKKIIQSLYCYLSALEE